MSTDALTDNDRIRRRLLDGLMASGATAWEHSLYRTRLFCPDADPTATWARRSHASNIERAGQHGVRPDKALDLKFNRQAAVAHERLAEERKWWLRRGVDGKEAGEGPRTPYETQLQDRFAAELPRARNTLAYHAIKSLSLHVSPLGPERERALCIAWYRAGFISSDEVNFVAATRAEWAEWFGVTPRWAAQWLRDIAAAEVGVTLRELPPAPGQRGWTCAVSLRLPDLGRMTLPQGATRHRALGDELARAWEEERRAGEGEAESRRWVGAGLVSIDDAEDDAPPPWEYDDVEEKVADSSKLNCGQPTGDAESLVNGPGATGTPGGEGRSSIESDAVGAPEPEPELPSVPGSDTDAGVPGSREAAESADGSASRDTTGHVPQAGSTSEPKSASEEPRETPAPEAGADSSASVEPSSDEGSSSDVPVDGGADAGSSKPRPKVRPTAAGVRERLHERLDEARSANKRGDTAAAEAILAELIEKAIPLITSTIFGKRAVARASLIEAYKRGDVVLRCEPEDLPENMTEDYLPGSEWPHGAALDCERIEAVADQAETPALDGAPEADRSQTPDLMNALRAVGVEPETADSAAEPQAPDATGVLYISADEPDAAPEAPKKRARPKTAGDVVAVQLALDGADGRELIRKRGGALRYRDTKTGARR